MATPPSPSSATTPTETTAFTSRSRRNATTPIPHSEPLFGTDMITVTLKGADNGNMVDFEGAALQMPGVTFKAVLTRLSD